MQGLVEDWPCHRAASTRTARLFAELSTPVGTVGDGARCTLLYGSSGFRVDEVVTDDTGGVEVKAAEVKVDGVAEPLAVAKPPR